jgi:hypothetical protein
VFYVMILLIGEIITASMAGGSSGVARVFLGGGGGAPSVSNKIEPS